MNRSYDSNADNDALIVEQAEKIRALEHTSDKLHTLAQGRGSEIRELREENEALNRIVSESKDARTQSAYAREQRDELLAALREIKEGTAATWIGDKIDALLARYPEES